MRHFGARVGDLSHHSHRIRPRLSVWVRILHRDRFLWRFDPVSAPTPSIVEEMLRIKERTRHSRGKAAVFFVDDNFAINVKRTKSLLRDIIAAGAQLSWVGQISANLLDEELLDLIAASGGKWIFIGMESLDPANLASVNKSFNKPADYAGCWRRWRGATSTPLRRSSSGWITTPPAWPSAPSRRFAIGRRGCRCSDRSLLFRLRLYTRAWKRKAG